MDKFIQFLKTYKGRDKILRLLCYLSKYIAGSLKSQDSIFQFDNLSTQLSTSRACFRLLDDVPTIAHILNKHNNKKIKNSNLENGIDILESLVDLIFCPLDHISWAIDHKILQFQSSVWETASTLCWVLSLYINIYKTTMKMREVSHARLNIKSKLVNCEQIQKLSTELWNLQLTIIKCAIDLIFATNYLPNGILWGKLFSKKEVGALGVVSSLISLYQEFLG